MGRIEYMRETCGDCYWSDRLSESQDVRNFYDEYTPRSFRLCYCLHPDWQGWRQEGSEACCDFKER